MTPQDPKCSSKLRCCNGVSAAFHSNFVLPVLPGCAAALCFHYITLFFFNLGWSDD